MSYGADRNEIFFIRKNHLLLIMGLFNQIFGQSGGSDHFSRGKAFFKDKAFSKANEEFDKALETASDPGEIILYKSQALQCQFLEKPEKGKATLVEALQIITREIDRRHNTPSGTFSIPIEQFYHEKGLLNIELSQYEEAIQSFNKCLERDTLFGTAYLHLHDVYKRIDRYPDAERVLNDAIREYGDFSRNRRQKNLNTSNAWKEMLFRKYLYLLSIGRMDEAEKTKEGYSFHDPKYNSNYTIQASNLLNTVQSGDNTQIPDSIAKLRPYVPYPEETLTRTLFIEAAYSLGLYTAALEEFYDYLHMKDRRNRKAWISAAKTLFALHKEKDALDVIEGILSYFPEDPELLVIRGRCLGALGRYEDAIIPFTTAISINPTYKAALNCKGYALSKMGKHQDALILYDKSFNIDPKDSGTIRLKASLLDTMYDVDRALQFLQSSLNDNTNSPVVLEYGGNLLYKRKKYVDALKWYEKAYSPGKHPIQLLPRIHCLILLQQYTEADKLLQDINKKMFSGLIPGFLRTSDVALTDENLKASGPEVIEVLLDYFTQKSIVEEHLGKVQDLTMTKKNLSVLKRNIDQYYPFINPENVFPQKIRYY